MDIKELINSPEVDKLYCSRNANNNETEFQGGRSLLKPRTREILGSPELRLTAAWGLVGITR